MENNDKNAGIDILMVNIWKIDSPGLCHEFSRLTILRGYLHGEYYFLEHFLSLRGF